MRSFSTPRLISRVSSDVFTYSCAQQATQSNGAPSPARRTRNPLGPIQRVETRLLARQGVTSAAVEEVEEAVVVPPVEVAPQVVVVEAAPLGPLVQLTVMSPTKSWMKPVLPLL